MISRRIHVIGNRSVIVQIQGTFFRFVRDDGQGIPASRWVNAADFNRRTTTQIVALANGVVKEYARKYGQ